MLHGHNGTVPSSISSHMRHDVVPPPVVRVTPLQTQACPEALRCHEKGMPLVSISFHWSRTWRKNNPKRAQFEEET